MNYREQMAWQKEVIGEEALDFLNSRGNSLYQFDDDEIEVLLQQKRDAVSKRTMIGMRNRKM